MKLYIQSIDNSMATFQIITKEEEVFEKFSFHDGWTDTESKKWSWVFEKSCNSFADDQYLQLMLKVVRYLDDNFKLQSGTLVPTAKSVYVAGDSINVGESES